jgi:hypothetical protein
MVDRFIKTVVAALVCIEIILGQQSSNSEISANASVIDSVAVIQNDTIPAETSALVSITADEIGNSMTFRYVWYQRSVVCSGWHAG